MKLTLTLVAAATALLAGCSSPPKVVVPDGSGRKPVNSEARISEYRARTGEEQAAFAERSALTRQIAYLQGEIQQLKMYVIQLSTLSAGSEATPVRAAVPATAPPVLTMRMPLGAAAGLPATVATESLEVRESAVVFRVLQPFARAEFSPSMPFQGEFLSVARKSDRIDIRGRTDAVADNAVDRSIAQRRALCARAFLIDNGIPAAKIHLSFLAAGDRVASNATPQGRAMNRRVEIETFGVNTHELRIGAGDVVGGL